MEGEDLRELYPSEKNPREKNKSKARNRIEEMVKVALQIKPTP